VLKKTYEEEFKAMVALDAIKSEMTINQITSKHGIHSTQIVRWKQKELEEVMAYCKIRRGIYKFLLFSNGSKRQIR